LLPGPAVASATDLDCVVEEALATTLSG
jgi:hypothetical protein